MLKCIAIDDEPLALRQLQGYIAKINFLKLEKAFTNAIEAQQYLAGNPIDLIFRGYQHARPERCGVRTFARQPPDDYLHDGLFGIRRRGIQTRCDRLPAQTDRPRGAAACRGTLPCAERGHRPRRIAERNPQPARIQTALCRAFQRPDRPGADHRHRLFLLGRENTYLVTNDTTATSWISRSTSFRTNWIPGGFSAYRAVASSPCWRSSAS